MKEDLFNNDDRQYLQMMQGNIERMANNSANCKTWLTTILAGFMALTCGFDSLHWWLLLAIVPIAIFWYLDGFYLSLERGMRNREKDFLNKSVVVNDAYKKALYNFGPMLKDELKEEEKEQGLVITSGQWWTKSVCPFYMVMIAVIIVVTIVINCGLFTCSQQ